VTQEDYNFWRARFGATSGVGTSAAVPEPAAITLLLAAVALFVRRRV
jgi:hypothetical protein